MRVSADRLRRQIAGCLVLILAVPFGVAATAGQQQPLSGKPVQEVSSEQSQPQSSQSVVKSTTGKSQTDVLPPAPDSVNTQSSAITQESGTSQSTSEPLQSGTQKPVGTAVAPYEKTSGVAVSRPAGAVIAPAKQRRARSFLIKVGVLLGAGIAIGTVVALSSASPSRPH